MYISYEALINILSQGFVSTPGGTIVEYVRHRFKIGVSTDFSATATPRSMSYARNHASTYTLTRKIQELQIAFSSFGDNTDSPRQRIVYYVPRHTMRVIA